MNSTRPTIKVDCSKCNGTGSYLHYGGCFRCDGRGYHTVDAAKHAADLAGKAERDAAWKAAAEAELAAERAIHALYLDACDAVARGVGAARAWFTAHRGNAGALFGLIGAMRDRRTAAWDERSNAIAAYLREHRATLDRTLTAHQGF